MTSSTQCMEQLWHDMGSTWWYTFHTPPMMQFVDDPQLAEGVHLCSYFLSHSYYQKRLSINVLLLGYCMAHGLNFHVDVNLITRNMLQQKPKSPPLLHKRLHENIMKCKNPHRYTETTIYSYHFASIVDWFGHFQHEAAVLE